MRVALCEKSERRFSEIKEAILISRLQKNAEIEIASWMSRKMRSYFTINFKVLVVLSERKFNI